MLLFLDLETTGFDNTNDSILEIAAARWDGEKIIARYETLIKIDAHVEISPFVQHLTGINPEMCENEGIPMSQAQEELHAFLQEDDIITGHNISFDTGFLKANNFNVPQSEIDTFVLSLLIMGRTEESHSLEVLSEKYGLVHENAHRAMSDVEANIEFYHLMEIFWIHNFSQIFHSFVEEKLEHVTFPEQYFFTNSFARKEVLQKEEMKKSLLPVFTQKWNDLTDECKEIISILEEKDEEKRKSIFWETNQSDRNIKQFVLWAEEKKKPLVLVYPNDKKMKYQEFFEALQKDLGMKDSRIFQNDAGTKFDEIKWNTFREKSEKNREEVLVFAKTIRATQCHEEHALKFMREEGVVARTLYSEKQETPFPENFSVIFVPFTQHEYIPENCVTLFLEGERIEDCITEQKTEKTFTKRWRENEGENKDQFSEAEKDFDVLLTQISKILRKEKGENEYTLHVPYSSAKNISEFPALWMHGKNMMETLSSKTQNAWKKFFSLEMDDNFFFCIELFPDNQLAFSATPIDITKDANALLSKKPIIIGSAFPRQDNQILFSFAIEKEFFDIISPFPVHEKFTVPKEDRTISPKEAFEYIKEYMQTGENIVFSVNSKRVCEELSELTREYIKENSENNASEYTVIAQGSGSVGKMRVQLQKNQKKICIATPRYLDILRIEDFSFTTLMIMKPIFDPPKQPFLSARRELYRSDFEDFAIPRAVARFEKELRRLENPNQIFLGDGRTANKKSWARVFWRGE